MPENQRFDIILIVWNRKGNTARTIASLINSGAASECDRFIVVDNCSTEEGMYEALDTVYKDLTGLSGKVWLLRRAKNDGWATAVNDAIGLSRAPFVLLANNDVDFTPNFHHKMLNTMTQHENIGLMGGWRHTSHSYTGVELSGFKEMTDIPAVAWMLSKRAMIQVGMLPEHGPCMTKGGNGEDSKYVQMMKAAGFLAGVSAEDVATHHDGY